MASAAQLISSAEALQEKISSRTAAVGVIGLGYVGLPLAVQFASAGFEVTGFDTNDRKVSDVNAGRSYVLDVSDQMLTSIIVPPTARSAVSGDPGEVNGAHRRLSAGALRATSDTRLLQTLDTISICVPTPLHKTKDPDMSYIDAACQMVASALHPGTLVVLESTTYPGTTREVVLPALAKSGLTVGRDFFLCFSPERVDPGNAEYQTVNIPKVLGGVTSTCTEMGQLLYSQAVERVVPVSSTDAAEMVKLLENTFRMINIGLANEIAMMCDRIGINVWEVIEAAATKPFGFMPFYPGPGLGGHCIPVDPFYLSWRSRQAGIEARFIELAGNINGQMPRFVLEKVQNALNDDGKPLRGSHVHIMGVAYKRDIDDVRESPALDLIQLLSQRGAHITYSDPGIPRIRIDGRELCAEATEDAVEAADCVVIVTDHSSFNYGEVAERAVLIVDTRNAMRRYSGANIVRL